jgi:hypothetical protein
MNKEKDEELDKLFKKGMEDPVNEAAFRDADWDAMEQMLDKGKKRPAIIYWLPVIGSAAALLLIFLGYLFLKPEVVKPTKKNQVTVANHSNPNTVDQKKGDAGTSGEPARQAAVGNKQQTKTSAKYADNQARSGQVQKSKSFFTLSSGKVRRNAAGNREKNITITPAAETTITNEIVKNSHPDTLNNSSVIAANTIPGKKEPVSVNDRVQLGTADDKIQLGTADDKKQKENTDGNTLTSVAPKVKSISRQKSGNRPQFAFGVVASSDLNGVNSSFQQSRIGGNFGALLSVTFAKKWTITTGASYDIKPYITSFDNYHTAYKFTTEPSTVNANCRMLDIPLNINYQVYKRQANTFTLGTGLSSYFMLREDYKFNYVNSYNTTGPSTYTVINKNRNILSVLNLDATYTHQINSKMGVIIEPYLKVPLSDVGASQVRLQTTGVALGLSWNLNTSSKPK